jgi:dTDP-4-dehydrorhamnose 3,5-epimerase
MDHPIKPTESLAQASLAAAKDRQSITADWNSLQKPMEGVVVKEVKNVVKTDGDVLCEIFRREWLPDNDEIEQVFQSMMSPGSISAWHVHQFTTDRLFASQGLLRIVLYDARPDSSSYERVNEFRFGEVRPALLTIPPGVWHGVQNISKTTAVLLNLVDQAYRYEDPDHWRLPLNTEKIPYRFER